MKFECKRDDIADAVRYHTTGKANMSPLCKTLYMADFVSADRDYPGVEDLRIQVREDFDGAMKTALCFVINELTEKRKPIHPDTLAAYNEHMMKGNRKNG